MFLLMVLSDLLKDLGGQVGTRGYSKHKSKHPPILHLSPQCSTQEPMVVPFNRIQQLCRKIEPLDVSGTWSELKT